MFQREIADRECDTLGRLANNWILHSEVLVVTDGLYYSRANLVFLVDPRTLSLFCLAFMRNPCEHVLAPTVCFIMKS